MTIAALSATHSVHRIANGTQHPHPGAASHTGFDRVDTARPVEPACGVGGGASRFGRVALEIAFRMTDPHPLPVLVVDDVLLVVEVVRAVSGLPGFDDMEAAADNRTLQQK